MGLFDGDLGDAGVQLRLRGQKFGVEFRRIDRRERLPCLHMIANIDKPFGDIAVHARVNGGLVPRRRLARKRKGLSWRRRTYRNDIDARLLRHVMVRRIGQSRFRFCFLAMNKEKPKAQPQCDHDGDA